MVFCQFLYYSTLRRRRIIILFWWITFQSITNGLSRVSITLLSDHLVRYDWDTSKFPWEDLSSQRKFMDELSSELRFSNRAEFTSTMIKQHGGSELLRKYGGSVEKLLSSIYPEYQNAQWCELLVAFLAKFYKSPKIKLVTSSTWKSTIFASVVPQEDGLLRKQWKHSMRVFLLHFSSQILRIWLENCNKKTPMEFTYYPREFPKVQHFWHDISYQREWLDSLASKLKIPDKSGWYNVTSSTIKEHGGSRLLSRYNSLSTMFSTIYPEYHKKLCDISCGEDTSGMWVALESM